MLGRNGVGKTTLLATLMGFTNRHRGTIRFGGQPIETLAVASAQPAGPRLCPAGARDFSVAVGRGKSSLVARRDGGWALEAIYDLFPALKERRNNSGNRLSGGEQQMLAVGRALVGAPKLLLLDEPTEGLAPIVVDALVRRAGADPRRGRHVHHSGRTARRSRAGLRQATRSCSIAGASSGAARAPRCTPTTPPSIVCSA